MSNGEASRHAANLTRFELSVPPGSCAAPYVIRPPIPCNPLPDVHKCQHTLSIRPARHLYEGGPSPCQHFSARALKCHAPWKQQPCHAHLARHVPRLLAVLCTRWRPSDHQRSQRRNAGSHPGLTRTVRQLQTPYWFLVETQPLAPLALKAQADRHAVVCVIHGGQNDQLTRCPNQSSQAPRPASSADPNAHFNRCLTTQGTPGSTDPRASHSVNWPLAPPYAPGCSPTPHCEPTTPTPN